MDKNEAYNLISDMCIEHDISLGSIEIIQEKEKNRINTIESVFDLKSKADYEILAGIILLLNKDSDDIYSWFNGVHENNPLSIKNLNEINKEILTIVIAAFMEKPGFFSMAWNWNILNLNSIEAESWIYANAASSYDDAFGEKKIPDIGIIDFQYDKEMNELTMRIRLDEGLESKNIRIIQRIKIKKTGEEYDISFHSNGYKKIYGTPILNIDPAYGVKYDGKPQVIMEK